MNIHTTIPLSAFDGNIQDIVHQLFEFGIPKPIKVGDFDDNDQPICYYADGQKTQYGGGYPDGGKIESKFSCWNEKVIVINFNKEEDQIFIEKQNNTNCIFDEDGETEADYEDDSDVYALEPWFNVDGAKLFEVGKRRDVKLSEFNKLCEINVLFGFAVRNIKPEEITSIEYCEGDDMFKVEVIERFMS